MPATKIATCCYCGTRAALVFDKSLHELTCQSCGAPLHAMKSFKATERTTAAAPTPARPAHGDKKRKVKKEKKKKSFKQKAWGEIWDIVEDIFD